MSMYYMHVHQTALRAQASLMSVLESVKSGKLDMTKALEALMKGQHTPLPANGTETPSSSANSRSKRALSPAPTEAGDSVSDRSKKSKFDEVARHKNL